MIFVFDQLNWLLSFDKPLKQPIDCNNQIYNLYDVKYDCYKLTREKNITSMIKYSLKK